MQPDAFQRPWALILLAILILAGLFVNLGGVPLFDEDEGAYAEVTHEMLQSGDLLVPHLEGKTFFHKPPMIYWTQAACVYLLGLNEFALRLPSALASLLWAILLFLFLRRHGSAQSAWLAPFFLVTALQTGIIAKAAIADALLNLFIAATMLAFYEYIHGGRKFYLWCAFGAMALGFLTKGPIAVAIPAVTGTVYFIFQKQFMRWLKMGFDPIGWLVFLLLALPWYVALYAKFGGPFIKELILVHNLGRFQGAMEGHSGPFFYYLPVILLGLLPYTTLLFVAGRETKTIWFDPLGRFLLIWFGFVLVLFSMADTKLHHYIVYGYVPLLIFMAQHAARAKRTWTLLAPAIFFMLLLWLVPLIAGWIAPSISDEFARVVITGAKEEFDATYYIMAGLALVAVIAVGWWKKFDLPVKLILTGIIFAVLINGYVTPKVAAIMQAPVKSAALLAREKGYDVVMWQMNYPSFGVYYGRPVLRRQPQPGDVVITKASKLKDIKQYQILYEKHGVVLTRVLQLK
ncbi:MAG: glycosyltransferase family 39 protein [Desulfobacteraceae bacterium]|nr:glycosyltransferase family 39 protein [Desulfobacteraceae bacterium]